MRDPHELSGPGPAATRRRWGFFRFGVLIAVLVLCACGDADPAGDTGEESAAAATPGASGGEEQPREATTSDANTSEANTSGVPGGLLISAEALPSGWRDSNPPNSAFRMTVCGVDTEPTEPEEVAQQRFAQTAVGPFLYQYVRTYADADIPVSVTSDLAAALPGCTSFSTRGTAPGSPEAHFDVEAIEVAGLPDGAVAWRMTPAVEGPMVQDVVFVPVGTSLVAFLSGALDTDPDPAALEAAVRALAPRR